MKLSEALERAKNVAGDPRLPTSDVEEALIDLIDAVEETLMAQKREADILLDLADLRRWGGCE